MGRIITIPFTDPFIDRLADHIERDYITAGKDMRRMALVFGGRRPALFLKRALARRIKNAYYPPKIFTIDELMGAITHPLQRRTMLDLDHCFAIYELACTYVPSILKGREQFVQFLPWAREILSFIEHLDLEDTPAHALQMLKEHATLGFNVPADINHLLEALMVLRAAYHQYLDDNYLTSRGYQYLNAARLVKDHALEGIDELLFCNFFYLHRTEMTVIKSLYDQGRASLLMQGDQRRWPALQRIARHFGQDVVEGEEVTPTAFKLHVYAAFDQHAQAGLVSEVLKNIDDHSSTVIVLPNPDAMLPMLSAISPLLDEFNISLGYPLKRSALYALLEFIIQAHKTMKGPLYYSRDYLRVLRHPLVKNLRLETEINADATFSFSSDASNASTGVVRVLVHKLEEVLTGAIRADLSGQIFVSIDDIVREEVLFAEAEQVLRSMDISMSVPKLKELMRTLHTHLFSQWQELSTFTQLAQVLDRFCVLMADHSPMAHYPLNEQVAVRLREIATEWAHAKCGDLPFDRADLLRMVQERLGRELVAFSGSPLRGLQILGLLETRSLSFRHVIVLDVNERVLPNLNIYEPLIPREVMIKMNLDRLELEEEIQRYQFMRLISSAKHVHLIYLERPDKERSRFIEELVWEQEQKVNQADCVPVIRPAFKVAIHAPARSVKKTPAMIEFLKSFTFSATSVNTYMRNPYEFYLNYVLGLRAKEDLLDDAQSRQVGTFVHEILETAFKPFTGKKPIIDDAFRRHFMKLFDTSFHRIFGRGMKSDAFLIRAVLENRLARFLDVEAKRVEESVEEILFIERKFDDVILLSCGPVRFSYRTDRVERHTDGTIMVIDYKTGGSDAMPSQFEPPADPCREIYRDTLISFQMPLYVHYLDKTYPGQNINAALYHLRTMEIEKFISPKLVIPREQLIRHFITALDFIMSEIFNPEIAFYDDPAKIN